MRTTVTFDDEQLKAALELGAPEEKSALVRAALEAWIQREAGRRLARLGGAEPGFRAPPRRRPPAK